MDQIFYQTRTGFMEPSMIDEPEIRPAAPSAATPGFRVPLFCSWLLMAITFSIPTLTRIAPRSLGSLDAVSLMKLFTRFSVMVILGIMLLKFWHHPKRPRVLHFLMPLAVFVGWAIISTSWSALWAVSLGQASSVLVLLVLAINLGIQCNTTEDISRILKNLVIAMFTVSAITLIIFFAFPNTGSLNRGAQGILHPTNAAANAGLGLVILIAAKLIWNWQWSRHLILPGGVIFSTLLYFAANRMSVGLVLLLTAIMLFFLTKRVFFSGFLFVMALLGALYVAADPGLAGVHEFIESFTRYIRRGQTVDQLTAVSGRMEMWQVMWGSFLESPWIGHGYFVTSKTGSLYVWFKEGNWTAHNMLMQVLVGTGIIGLFLFLYGILRPGMEFIRSLLLQKNHPRLGLFLLIIALWYGIWSITNESIAGPLMPETVVFYSILGLAIGVRVNDLGEARQFQSAQTVREDHPFENIALS